MPQRRISSKTSYCHTLSFIFSGHNIGVCLKIMHSNRVLSRHNFLPGKKSFFRKRKISILAGWRFGCRGSDPDLYLKKVGCGSGLLQNPSKIELLTLANPILDTPPPFWYQKITGLEGINKHISSFRDLYLQREG